HIEKLMVTHDEEASIFHQIITSNPAPDGTIIFNIPTINPTDSYDDITNLPRTNCYYKIYKRLLYNKIPVICKYVHVDNTNESKRLQAYMSKLNSMQPSNKILKFYG